MRAGVLLRGTVVCSCLRLYLIFQNSRKKKATDEIFIKRNIGSGGLSRQKTNATSICVFSGREAVRLRQK
jgi:hypothetical protein